ncbi:hypothetical protein B0T18DRAFT_426635 [Schizothecium vesticola]|uniref:Uncharacterized protein n=1 Tax=Schizothecium vesticola TaxID=314040 RepID=A0AA40F6I0_9PEZI|nr:hypothetical protein B0T18DRAFT_426635 [Schizothecium vesticola]
MGGRHWSAEEEAYFWNTIIPKSPKRQGIKRNDPEMSWEELAAEMNSVFEGPERRRVYTGQGIFEHWFLNVQKGSVSKNARRYVDPYVAQMVEDGAGRTGLGFAKKQGPRAPRRAPVKQTTAQKKARLRPAQRNTLRTLSGTVNEEVAEAARPNTPGAVGNSSTLNPSTADEDDDVRDAEVGEDALFVGDGTPVESWDSTPTANASVSHNLSNNSTGSARTIKNAHRLPQAAFAPANLVAQSTTHVESAASAAAITPAPHSTSSSRLSQAPQLISDSVEGAWDYSHYQSMASVGDVWDYQLATYTDEPSDRLQAASSRVSQAPQTIPSHTTDRSTNSTGGNWDSEAMSFTGMPSNYPMGRVNSSGTSQQTVSLGAPSIVNPSNFIYGRNQSGHGQRSNGQCGNNQRDNGQRNNGQSDNGQHGHGQRGSGHLNYGQHGYGYGYGQRDNGHRSYGTAASNFTATSHPSAASNATYDWRANPPLGLGDTGENSAILGATAEHAASGQTPAASYNPGEQRHWDMGD